MLTKIDQLKEMLLAKPEKKKMGVVASHDEHTLQGVYAAAKDGIIEPVLYGFAAETEKLWKEVAPGAPVPEIIPCETVEECVDKALLDVHAGKIQCIMKGILDTAVIMRGVLNSEKGIKGPGILSQFGILESPYYHKLFCLTDVGLQIAPDLQQKKAIIENAVWAFRELGVETPKVAVLAAIEKVNPKMQPTVDAAELRKMWENGEIENCILEGPLSYDIAVSAEIAKTKGFESEIAGDVDIMLVPDITAGNISVKALIDTGGAISCGTIIGAKVPIALTTRGATAEDKYRTIILTALLGTRN